MKPKLEDLPNIGKRIAADLRSIGISTADELKRKRPIAVFHQLEPVMGPRHDPCVLYTLLSVKHYFDTGEKRPWWEFTSEGKTALQANSPAPRRVR